MFDCHVLLGVLSAGVSMLNEISNYINEASAFGSSDTFNALDHANSLPDMCCLGRNRRF